MELFNRVVKEVKLNKLKAKYELKCMSNNINLLLETRNTITNAKLRQK